MSCLVLILMETLSLVIAVILDAAGKANAASVCSTTYRTMSCLHVHSRMTSRRPGIGLSKDFHKYINKHATFSIVLHLII